MNKAVLLYVVKKEQVSSVLSHSERQLMPFKIKGEQTDKRYRVSVGGNVGTFMV